MFFLEELNQKGITPRPATTPFWYIHGRFYVQQLYNIQKSARV